MSSCCPRFESAADRQFDDKKAREELQRYRTDGPGPTTRLLEEGLAQAGRVSGTLLDIGSGVGSLTFELLDRGVLGATAVDASSAYITAARGEAERRGRADVARFVHGDFVTAAHALPAATIVTLDRVVCCYPSYAALLDAALHHAEACIALSYPRDVVYVRLGVMLENAFRRLRGNAFRMFVHPANQMQHMIQSAGFELAGRRETWVWSIDVYTRPTR